MRVGIRRVTALLGWALFALALLWGPAHAQAPVPGLSAQVMDFTATLNDDQLRALRGKLAEFEKAHGTQIVVLMVASTAPEDIAAYAHRVASTWKIGRRDTGDGLLLIVAKDDRRLRIEVARSLEGAVTDLAAKNVIDSTITPRFRQGDYAGGLDAGLDALFRLVLRENLPAPTDAPAPGTGPHATLDWSDVGVLTFFAFVLFSMFLSQELGPRRALPLGALAALPSGGAYVWGWQASPTHSAGQSAYFFTVTTTVILLILWIHFRHRNDLPRKSKLVGVTSAQGSSIGIGEAWDLYNSLSSTSSSGGNSGGFSSGGGGSFGGGGSSGSW